MTLGPVRTLTFDQVVQRQRSLGPSEPRVVISGNSATPRTLADALLAARERCRVFQLNAQSRFTGNPAFVTETPFVGPGMRHDPMLDYLPMRLSLVPSFLTGAGVPDAVLVQTSPPRGGKVLLGIEVNVLPAAIESARRHGGLVVAQVNRHMPYTLGDAELDADDIDLAVEHDVPLPSPLAASGDETSAQIGERVGALVEDGSTLQVGIGGVPDATLACLGRRRELRVWSEMVSDGILGLERAGALDQARRIVASFLFGSEELYRWADRNERLRLARTETTNDPVRIARNDRMVSLNSALQVDLFAQANASWVRGRVYSGFGGQTDFIVGALHSAGGHAVIALPSWHPRADCSSIVPLLEAPVTSFQHSAVVTEQGCAFLFGRSQREQASAIAAEAAHPRARSELEDAIGRLGLAH